jgi:hypothetical protein
LESSISSRARVGPVKPGGIKITMGV